MTPLEITDIEKCLVIEDSEIDRLNALRLLGPRGLRVNPIVASSLEQARKTLSEHIVGLILLDNQLPDGYGSDFAVELSCHRIWKDIPVVIVSDWPSPFMFAKAKHANVCEICTKDEFNLKTAGMLIKIHAPKLLIN